MASVQDIRDLVSSYVSDEISASELANRFSPVLRAAIKSNDIAVKDVALAVHAQVAGFFNGLLSEEAFAANLRPIAEAGKQGLVSLTVQTINMVEPERPSFNTGYRPVVMADFQLVPTA